MQTIEIRKAVEADASKVLDILRSVALWLEGDGPGKLWDASSFALPEIARKVRRSDVVVLEADHEIAACMYVEKNDDIFWPDALPGEALYLHKIAVDRPYAGLGFSRLLIDWAAQYAERNGCRFLRLDCAPRPKLVHVYMDAGFHRVGEDSVIDGFLVARLQRDLSASPSIPL